MRDVDLVELAPCVGPACDFDDRFPFIEMLEPSVGIGLESALVELQVLLWVLSLAVGRVGEPDRWCGRISRWPIIANIRPEPSGLGSSVAWGEYGDWRVVSVELAGRHHMITYCIDKRCEQIAGCTNPSGQRRAIKIYSLARIDLRLPVKRQVVCILGNQHMSEQPRSRKPTIDRSRWCRCLHDLVTGVATQLRAHMADDLEAGPHSLQHLCNILAQLA